VDSILFYSKLATSICVLAYISRQVKLQTQYVNNHNKHLLLAFTHLLFFNIHLFLKQKNIIHAFNYFIQFTLPSSYHFSFALHLFYLSCFILTLVIAFTYLFSLLIRNFVLENHLVDLTAQGTTFYVVGCLKMK
jgi:hypothetical protein